MSFDVKRYDLRLVECESLWSLFHRWLAALRRPIGKEGENGESANRVHPRRSGRRDW